MESLKAEMNAYKQMNSLQGIMTEREQLVEEIRRLKIEGVNSLDIRYLQTKLFHFEKLVEKLENEKQ